MHGALEKGYSAGGSVIIIVSSDLGELCSWFTRCNGFNCIIIIITSTSDLQPSTAIANQLPGQ